MEIRGLKSEDVWDYENGYYWFSPSSRLNKLLAHYELYKIIKDIPGDIIELGVYKSASLIRFASFRDIFENGEARRIIGFDAFGKFPREYLNLEEDHDFIDRFDCSGGEGLSLKETKEIMQSKGFSNIQLIKGNILETIPRFLTDSPHTRIAMLHLDLTVKEPTAFALQQLYNRVVKGGLIIIDDYNSVAGATDATDEFIKEYGLRLKKLPHYNVPAFIVN